MLCSSDGSCVITYKNAAAVKMMKTPIRGSSMINRLKPEYKSKYAEFLECGKSDFFELKPDGLFFRALVFKYDYNGQTLIAWLFLTALQQPLMENFIISLSSTADKLACRFIEYLDYLGHEEVSSGAVSDIALTRYKNTVAHISGIIDELYGEWTDVYNRNEFYLHTALESLRVSVGNYLPRSGYRCEFNIDNLPNNLVMRDIGRVMAALFCVLALALELSTDHLISQKAYFVSKYEVPGDLTATDNTNNDDKTVFEFNFNAPLPANTHISDADISVFAELFAECVPELAILSQLTLYRGWTLKCYADTDRQINTLIRIEMITDENKTVYGAPSADPRCDFNEYNERFAQFLTLFLGESKNEQ